MDMHHHLKLPSKETRRRWEKPEETQKNVREQGMKKKERDRIVHRRKEETEKRIEVRDVDNDGEGGGS